MVLFPSHGTELKKINEAADVILLIIHAQNAALVIRLEEHGVVFESFELSTQPGPVLESKSSLRRSFPSGAVLVPKSIIDDAAFRIWSWSVT